jgi:transaldolase / glucose-6-phosphate isomerase
LGGEFFRWQVATAIAGSLLELNPFDEPNVLQSKQATAALLDAPPQSGTPLAPGDHAIAEQIRSAQSGDYVALLAYLDRTEPRARAFAGIRTALRDRLGVATTLGYGPRYLHSTGQLHKGGPPSGIHLVLSGGSEDLAIPGKGYGFATLIRAQALGDLQALSARGRRVLHIDLGADCDAGLTQLGRQLAAL